MRKAKHILTVILLVAVLSSGLPFFHPEDANRDSRVDLEDVILHVQDFVQTTDNPATFTSNVKKVLSTLHVVAGLKTYIKPVKDTKSSNSLPALDRSYLVPSADFSIPSYNSFQLREKPFLYESIVVLPTSPPPRHA